MRWGQYVKNHTQPDFRENSQFIWFSSAYVKKIGQGFLPLILTLEET